MAIHFACECGARYSVQVERAGRRLKCLECGRRMKVPALPDGERRTRERRQQERRRQRDTDDAGTRPREERRTGERRRRQRRRTGGMDVSHLPEVMPHEPYDTEPRLGRSAAPPPEAVPDAKRLAPGPEPDAASPWRRDRRWLALVPGLLVLGSLLGVLWFLLG